MLKAVFISSKSHKKQLLISHKKGANLCFFLKKLIRNDVLIINTNWGVEIYYNSLLGYSNSILNSFLLFLSKKGAMANDYNVVFIKDTTAFTQRSTLYFSKLANMPLGFSNYSKSVLHQLNIYENNTVKKMIFKAWQESLLTIFKNQKSSKKIYPFLTMLQYAHLETNYSPLLKKLLRGTLSSLRSN
ncbi:hypothetical protein [Tenacibaculum maritimum]|uniref:hypothetical protein n=1 Tax=Tenacibaculum maritimum TaxID=107401 RepID=UPI001E616D75|nr:hypothetical protein [Tenacibaculum maritimum]MCD9611597.1 hypothetical protein [Tenacibaculum maritimum]